MDYLDAIVDDEKRRSAKTRYDWSKLEKTIKAVVMNIDDSLWAVIGDLDSSRVNIVANDTGGWRIIGDGGWYRLGDKSIILNKPDDYLNSFERRP